MTVKLAKSSSLVFSVFCTIATIPLLLVERPGNTQALPLSTLAQLVPSPGPNPAAIPTLDPNAEPPAPIPSPTPTPQLEPSTLPASPAPVSTPSPEPTATPAPAPAMQTSPPTTPSASSGSRLSRYAPEPPVLAIGSKGEPVQDVQTFLKETGLYTGAVDGVFGAETEAAIKRFQESKNLTSDGVMGPATWTVMIRS